MTTKSKTTKVSAKSVADVSTKKKTTTSVKKSAASKSSTLLADGVVEAVKFGSLRESSMLYTKNSVDILVNKMNTSLSDIASKIQAATADVDEIVDMHDDVSLYEMKTVVNKLVTAMQKMYKSFSE